jgi:hypothetical protein
MRRDEQTNKKQNKQENKNSSSGTIEFQSYFKFWCYSSSIQSWCWYLSWSSVIVLPGGWVVFDFFFSFCFSEAAAWSALPSVVCGSLSLYVVLRFWNHLCSPPAVLLWSWVFTVLDYWGLVPLPCPLSLEQGQWSISWPPAVSMLWWFADYFSILQCHLTLDVANWLRRWVLWTATCLTLGRGLSPMHCQLFCLSSLCLLKVCMEISSLLFLPSLVCFQHLCPSAVC